MARERLTISNTTPVINLAEIGRLDILEGLFGKVAVPPAVVDELEAECIALAMEHQGSLLLLDDLQARALASSNGLAFTGTLGCLVEAKSRGWIDAVAPLLDNLRRSARFWISRRLEAQVLHDVGEA